MFYTQGGKNRQSVKDGALITIFVFHFMLYPYLNSVPHPNSIPDPNPVPDPTPVPKPDPECFPVPLRQKVAVHAVPFSQH
jgi:hypothetical protein